MTTKTRATHTLKKQNSYKCVTETKAKSTRTIFTHKKGMEQVLL